MMGKMVIRKLSTVVLVGGLWAAQGITPAFTEGTASDKVLKAAGLNIVLPDGWRKEQPTSAMRAAQAVIPGDSGDALMTLFFFGEGGGGSVEANIQRWIDQVELFPGTSPQQEVMESNGFAITFLEVSGTLKPGGMGMGPDNPVPDSQILGAVVEGPGGPWFFKAVGPAATLAGHRDAFIQMLQALRKF